MKPSPFQSSVSCVASLQVSLRKCILLLKMWHPQDVWDRPPCFAHSKEIPNFTQKPQFLCSFPLKNAFFFCDDGEKGLSPWLFASPDPLFRIQ